MSMLKIVFYIILYKLVCLNSVQFHSMVADYLVLFVLFPHVCVRFVADDGVKMHKVADQ